MKRFVLGYLYLTFVLGEIKGVAPQEAAQGGSDADEEADRWLLGNEQYEILAQDTAIEGNGRRLSTTLDRVVFYAMGDAPYTRREKRRFPFQIDAMDSRAAFAVHVGDIKIRNKSLCVAESYQEVSDMLQKSVAPVLMTPGDNDWLECNNRTVGYNLWLQHFARFEEKWETSLNVRHQESRPENFAFVYNGVHFVGLHVLFSSFRESPELYTILQDDVDWMNSELPFMQDPNVGAIVLFAHTFPRHAKFLPLKVSIEQAISSLDKPFLFVQGDTHIFEVSNPFPSADNFMLVALDSGGIADPLEVTVDVNSEVPFKLKRRPASKIAIT